MTGTVRLEVTDPPARVLARAGFVLAATKLAAAAFAVLVVLAITLVSTAG
jgi:hypothetical protein